MTYSKILIASLAAGLAVVQAQAALITAGDEIYVDFGVDTSTIVNANTISNVALTIADATRLSGGTTGVGIALTRSANEGTAYTEVNALAGNALNTTDALAYGDGLGIANGGAETMSITFTGLDIGLTYGLTGGLSQSAGTPATNWATGWTIENQAAPTYLLSDATVGAGYISFAGLTTSDGTLTITLDNNGKHGGVSQLQLTAIPEPGTYALLGGLLALGHVMVRRRRR